jgi:UDP-N-acetyl-D-glucosamine dehydrogenase
MDNFKIIKTKIADKSAKICIVGMGYVGLPLSEAFAKKGYHVYGYDLSASRIDRLNKGIKYITDIDPKSILRLIKQKKFFPTADAKVVNDSDVVIICVPTPLRKVTVPDISYVLSASKTVGKHARAGQLIILESTSYPGTTREVLLPQIKKRGLVEEKDFYIAFSPERVNPGDKNFPVVKIPKVVGGLSVQSGALAGMLYGKIIENIFPVSSPEAAEMCKLLENTFRLVNIALVNEFAMVAHKMNVDIWEVIEAAKTKPFGFMPFYPGPGAGGHCLPCDPVYLSWKAKKFGFKTKMIDTAVFINHYMPQYVVERVQELVGDLKGKKVLVVGATYKKDVADLRESPATEIIEKLKHLDVAVDYYDIFAPVLKIGSLDMKSVNVDAAKIKAYDCVVIATAHSKVDYKMIKNNAKLIFDTRNIFPGITKSIKKI